MSTSAIEAAWTAAIWNNATIKAITPNVIRYELTQESEAEIGGLRYNQEFNFFEVVTTRTHQFKSIGSTEAACEYLVEVRYTREKDTTGNNWTAVRDAFDTLAASIQNNLGTTWTGTVDYYLPNIDTLVIDSDIIADCACWRAVARFTGYKTETL